MDVGAKNHVTAAAAVTAIRTTPGHEFFAPETDAATPTVTGTGQNFYTIDKHTGAFWAQRSGKVPLSYLVVIPSRADGEGPRTRSAPSHKKM